MTWLPDHCLRNSCTWIDGHTAVPGLCDGALRMATTRISLTYYNTQHDTKTYISIGYNGMKTIRVSVIQNKRPYIRTLVTDAGIDDLSTPTTLNSLVEEATSDAKREPEDCREDT